MKTDFVYVFSSMAGSYFSNYNLGNRRAENSLGILALGRAFVRNEAYYGFIVRAMRSSI